MGPIENSLHSSQTMRQLSTFSAFLAVFVIIGANFFCYSRTLNAYFLADDFIHIAYLSEVFSGHPEKLLENFTGNWMHAWGTQFYRPFISLTLALDFALGQGNPLIFHISNTLFQSACSVFIFFITRRLLSASFLPQQQYITALAAGLFFAVCPLHTEVVSWVIGRVDSVCLAFNLAAFYYYLVYRESKSKKSLYGSLSCFVISLLSKEMAVILPPLIVLYELFFADAKSLTERCKIAAKASLTYFIVLLGYLGVRTLALGTLQGGYGGSIGESLTNSLPQRLSSLSKLFFPFNNEAIPPFDRLQKYILSLYRVSCLVLLVRVAVIRKVDTQLKLSLFCLLWMALSLVPTYQVFNITDTLMCSRFAYFATAGLSILLAVLVSPLWTIDYSQRKEGKYVWGTRISCVLIGLWVYLLGAITVRNNLPWAQGGSQVRSFRQALAEEGAKLNGEQKLAILNVPQRLGGAHLIYNGAMLSVLLSKPLSNPPLADKVLNFEPATYGDADLVSAARLRQVAAKNGGTHPAFFWDMAQKKLIRTELKDAAPFRKEFLLGKLDLHKLIGESSGSGVKIQSPPLHIEPSQADFVVIKLIIKKDLLPANANICISWNDGESANEFDSSKTLCQPLIADGNEHEYWFAVSEHKTWHSCTSINRLQIQLPPADYSDQINTCISAELLSGESLVPLLNVSSSNMARGVDGIDRPGQAAFAVALDASKIPNCKKVRIELSKPNSWFEHYSGTLKDTTITGKAESQVLKSYEGAGQKLEHQISPSDFPQKAYYELRGFALDESGKVIGFASDPIVLQID